MNRGIMLGLLGMAWLAAACDGEPEPDGGSCTEAGCVDALSLSIEADSGLFTAGSYEVALDGETICTFRVSDDLEECASGHCVAEESCNALYLVGYQDDGMSDLVSIMLETMQGPIAVEVRLEGGVLLSETVAPTYQTVQPNGPDCGPVCQQANETLVVPMP